MTASEPLLVRGRLDRGWAWGEWKGERDAECVCVVARATGYSTTDPVHDAIDTKLGRELTTREDRAIDRVDRGIGTDADRQIILRLAAAMGVKA